MDYAGIEKVTTEGMLQRYPRVKASECEVCNAVNPTPRQRVERSNPF